MSTRREGNTEMLYKQPQTLDTRPWFMLLEKGADVNAKGGRYGSALQAASDSGHEAVVRLLLQKGADVNAHGGPSGHALLAALANGHEDVVQLLLASGAKVKGDI